MSQFTNFDPIVSLLPIPYVTPHLGSPHSVVTRGFEYYIGNKEDNTYIYIPKGYLTDGATAPKWVRRWIPAWGNYGGAAIVHDYLCEYLEMRSQGELICITRAKGDYIFYEAMKVLGVPFVKRSLMYLAVRVYSITVSRNLATPWFMKRSLEADLERQYETHGNYDFLKDKPL